MNFTFFCPQKECEILKCICRVGWEISIKLKFCWKCFDPLAIWNYSLISPASNSWSVDCLQTVHCEYSRITVLTVLVSYIRHMVFFLFPSWIHCITIRINNGAKLEIRVQKFTTHSSLQANGQASELQIHFPWAFMLIMLTVQNIQGNANKRGAMNSAYVN